MSDHSRGQASAPATAPSPTAKESPNPPNPSCCRSTGGCGWLAGPPANTCSRNNPQNKQQQHPPKQKIKTSSCRHSVAACVSDHSCGQASAPATAPSPTAKESPNPPNPSCCRSRGGMRGWPVHRPTHAPATTLKTNGDSPPPKQKIKASRAAAPEHVKQSPNPPNPSCCRSRGGMRGWPVHRPTHAPATTLKTNGDSPPPKQKIKNPSCRHSVAACVSDHSCGQASAPATAPSPTAKESPNPP